MYFYKSWDLKVAAVVNLCSIFFITSCVRSTSFPIPKLGHSDVPSSMEFGSERCDLTKVSGSGYKQYYKLEDISPDFLSTGVIELLVKLKGPSDGHIILTQDSIDTEPLYLVVLGSADNSFSEIRRTKWGPDLSQKSTPSILSPHKFRGFVIKYNKNTGELTVFAEGSEDPLLYWVDPEPLNVRYFGFSAYDDIVVEIAFNCKLSGKHVVIPKIPPSEATDLRISVLDNYDHRVPPPSVGPVRVLIGLILTHFTLTEVDNEFSANVWFSMNWNDTRLAWNRTSINDTVLMRFSDEEIWKPDIALINSAIPLDTTQLGDSLLIVKSDGSILWTPPARLTTHCSMNLLRWPYDEHNCFFKIGSWTHSGKEIDLEVGPPVNPDNPNFAIDVQMYVRNSEWTLLNTKVEKEDEFYACCENPYAVVKYNFQIQRNSPSYMATLIVPIVVITVVNTMVFLLPPTAGEKITLAGINLLIVCMYLSYFEAKLPPFGDHIPLLVFLYSINAVLIGFSLMISVIVINIARNRKASSPPKLCRLFCNKQFVQLLGLGHLMPYVSQTHVRLQEGVEMRSSADDRRSRSSLDFATDKDEHRHHLVAEHESAYMVNGEWILLASVIDRITMIVYTVASGIILGMCLS